MTKTNDKRWKEEEKLDHGGTWIHDLLFIRLVLNCCPRASDKTFYSLFPRYGSADDEFCFQVNLDPVDNEEAARFESHLLIIFVCHMKLGSLKAAQYLFRRFVPPRATKKKERKRWWKSPATGRIQAHDFLIMRHALNHWPTQDLGCTKNDGGYQVLK